ncbi:MAG: hypothetical protein HDS37_00840 [Bacteroides sp.]|nr:hypothetical protein [Bacteroides sp.]
MNSKYVYAFAGLLLGLTACSNEDLTSPSETPVAGKTVHVTLTVDRSNGNTRTVVNENLDGLSLYSKWVEGDKLLVVNSANKQVGELTIVDGFNSSEGVFSGNATLANTETYTLIYLGGSNENGGAYAGWIDGTGISNPVATTPDRESGFTVSGALDDLCRADLMKQEGVQFLISDENACPAENVTLDAVNAMAHFTLTNLPTDYSGATLTVNYGEVKHTISTIGEDLYLPMPTGSYILSFSLVNGDDTYTASINGGNAVTVTPLYYGDTDDNGNGKGILVELKEAKPDIYTPLPLDESELVGPVFEINGRKFRFTKSNLKYNTETGVWSLIGEQYNYLCKAGWEHNDGSWGKNKETEIDQFGYGATGLYDAAKMVRAQIPTFWCESGDKGQASEAKYPTPNEELNKGYTGSYLEKGIQFTDFDWGRAYYLSKNNEPESTDLNPYTTYDWQRDSGFELKGKEKSLRYFTLTSDEWDYIVDHYYVIGATILNEPNPVLTDNKRKNNIYGLMILPIKSDEWSSGLRTKDKRDNKLPLFLNAVGTDSYTAFTKADVSFTSASAFKYESLKLTVEQFKEYEKIGAVFLPEAGYRDSQSAKTTPGYYWTSTNAQTLNATFLAFDGYSSSKVFAKYSKSRALGCSIRLVREVPANYEDPMVVY